MIPDALVIDPARAAGALANATMKVGTAVRESIVLKFIIFGSTI